MERLIRENFMAEWEIIDNIQSMQKIIKENKEYSPLIITDDVVDLICDQLITSIQIDFYKTRTNKNELSKVTVSDIP